ncbi:tannase/feruloyl esterase family alpha/beta hydrolase (plasmid) [Rhizobium leguminosarum bv. viciae]|uniref:Tannase/feruloyl esterase family alpha/beta hydrolase n=1 Tax=Rhizobium leguminosarum bv. viciae TaxID=387 RepID=A0A7G6RNZ0_RHILV|nr:tannase/feruloyl esterase family alpha/beta hydrolase [Rhizobium leguminosarum bv. viciae]
MILMGRRTVSSAIFRLATLHLILHRSAARTERTLSDTCLSNAQIQAVRLITSEYKPGVTIAGMDTFPKWPFLEGAPFQGPSNFGLLRQPSNPITGKEALLYSAGDQTVKFIVTRNPQFDAMTFDPQEWKDRLSVLGSIMDVTDVSLDGFLSKGGKIILIHGTADDLITPHNSIAYYQRQLSRYGQDRLDSFLRFYMIPGYGHGFGKFNAKYASLDALENWVENGRAPSGLIAVDGNPGANRSRPMCEWLKHGQNLPAILERKARQPATPV